MIVQTLGHSVRNFFDLYRPMADTWKMIDNSRRPKVIAAGKRATTEVVKDEQQWRRVRQVYKGKRAND